MALPGLLGVDMSGPRSEREPGLTHGHCLPAAGSDVGHRIGVDADTDQNVHLFEVSFTIGAPELVRP